jgi:hypothetical protein
MAGRQQRVSAEQLREGAVNVGGQVMVPIENEEFTGIPGGMAGDPNLIPQLPPQMMAPQMPQYMTSGDPDMDEEVFPGGPPRGLVEMWKAQFGEIYSSPFGDDVFIWRTMKRTEYKEVLRIQAPKGDTMFREEKICEKCVLWPIGYSHMVMALGKAGVPTLLAEQIMDKSGFTIAVEPERL